MFVCAFYIIQLFLIRHFIVDENKRYQMINAYLFFLDIDTSSYADICQGRVRSMVREMVREIIDDSVDNDSEMCTYAVHKKSFLTLCGIATSRLILVRV